MQRINQVGVADGELARLQFAQQINAISVNTGTPIAVVEQLAETAHRARVEEVEAWMNSYYTNEVRRIEVEAARANSNYEARCNSEVSELRQDACRAEMGNQQSMVGEHIQIVAGRDQAIHQLRTELAVSQTQLQNAANAESAMHQRCVNAEAVSKRLADEMNMAKAQIASMETTSKKILEDMRQEFALKEGHFRKKVEAEIASQTHTIGLLKAKVSVQTTELAEERAKVTESNEKHRDLYHDLKAMRGEMTASQDLRDELLECEMENRRLRAELDAAPKRRPVREPRSQGPMPDEGTPRRGGAFPERTVKTLSASVKFTEEEIREQPPCHRRGQ